jgi:sec-independent protein translocase protein TatC
VTTLEEPADEKKMPLLDHLIELRRRLIYCIVAFVALFFGCFYIAQDIFDFLVRPLARVLADMPGGGQRMIFTALHEAFFTYVKVAFFAAAFVGFPVIATQVWMFVAPGLYKNERRAFLPFLAATPFMFFLGGALVYFFIMPMAWQFLVQFQTPPGEGALPIQLEPKVDQYLSLSMSLIFAFGLAFETPVVLTLLARAGIITAEWLAQKRRYAIVIAFVIAAVLTPPDVFSQVGLAVPLCLLYEVSIWISRASEKRRAREEKEAKETDDEASPPSATTAKA